MSKRTITDSAVKNPQNFWQTPAKVTERLVPHLPPQLWYIEPCAGAGAIISVLHEHDMYCADAYDIEPNAPHIRQADAQTQSVEGATIITNPPYARHLLQPLLDHWIGSATCWLLLPLDMAVNVWTNSYMEYVSHILPVGRVSWLGNGKSGMDNSAWFRFAREPAGLILPRG